MRHLKSYSELRKQYENAFTSLMKRYNKFGFGIYNEAGDSNMNYYYDLREVCQTLYIDYNSIEEKICGEDSNGKHCEY